MSCMDVQNTPWFPGLSSLENVVSTNASHVLCYHPLDECFAIITVNFQRFPIVFPVFFIGFLPTLGCILWSTPTITFRFGRSTPNFIVYGRVRTAYDSGNITQRMSLLVKCLNYPLSSKVKCFPGLREVSIVLEWNLSIVITPLLMISFKTILTQVVTMDFYF